VFIPVLPKQLNTYIEAFLPYIIGVTPDMINDIDIPADAVRLNLDTGEL